jgi:hypothetical protein
MTERDLSIDISKTIGRINTEMNGVLERRKKAGNEIESIVGDFSSQFTSLGIVSVCRDETDEILYDVSDKRLFKREINFNTDEVMQRDCFWGEWIEFGGRVVTSLAKAEEKRLAREQERMHEQLVDAFGPDGNFR